MDCRPGRLAALALIVLLFLPIAAKAQERVALVVGNGSYRNAVPLPNPANDATDMAAALRELGFEVIAATDVDKTAFDSKLREFARALRTARTALFFYAGHGMQVAGKNYAIPVDARLESAADLQVETVDIEQVLAVMQADDSRVNLVFLDACRDNPLTRSFVRTLPQTRSASVGTGLSQVDAGRGTLIAFATAPNKVAFDGQGQRNSLFTTALLKHLRTPGLDIALVMRRVTADVEAASRGAQVPWIHASLTTDVALAPGAKVGAPSVPPPNVGPPANNRTPPGANVPSDEMGLFIAKLLGNTEIQWKEIFEKAGQQYRPPTLVLYSGATASGMCGTVQKGMGPAYCPDDRKIYLDPSLFSERSGGLRGCESDNRLCQSAQAYIIAHQVGHHVQNILGILSKAKQTQQNLDKAQVDRIQLRVELQADCLAGIWARRSEAIQTADVEAILRMAASSADNRAQEITGHAIADNFGHGTLAQRQHWFETGLKEDTVRACNTFAAASP